MEKEVFERLLQEFNELNVKINNLRDFLLDEEKVKKLNMSNKDLLMLNKDLLIVQLKQMEGYLATLSIRIGLNAPKENLVDETEKNLTTEVSD